MEQRNYKIYIVSTIALLLLVLLIGGYWGYRNNKSFPFFMSKKGGSPSLSDVMPSGGAPLDSGATTTAGTAGTQTNTISATNSKAPAPSVRYQDAITKYAYRIQFTNCHGIVNTTGTGTLSVKRNTSIMLDNRDSIAHTIAFKGQSYKVGPYDFVIATAKTLGEYPITCDGGGAAQLNVEP